MGNMSEPSDQIKTVTFDMSRIDPHDYFKPKPGCLVCFGPNPELVLHRVPIDCYTQEDVDRWDRQEAERQAVHDAAECKVCDDTGYVWDEDCRECGEYGRGSKYTCPACVRGAEKAWLGLAPTA